MDFKIDQKVADELMKIKEEVRGVAFKTDGMFVLRESGEESLKKIEEEFKKLGYPFKYESVSSLGYYPLGMRIISLLLIAKVLNLDEEGVKGIGASASRMSLIIKLFMQYFLSLEKTLGQIGLMWKKHYSIGEMSIVEVNEKKKKVILRLENFNIHPIMCLYLAGFFAKIGEMVIREKVEIKETKCSFNEGSCHEFVITW